MMQAVHQTASAPFPRPTDVRYNDWRQVALPSPEEFTPTLPVSVVAPCYQVPAATLSMTLAALEGQTYPRDLFEVVLVDDGSEPPLVRPRSPLNVRVVRQERRGFGIARARNTGVAAAAHGIVLFLDADTLVEADWMAAHARWHHAVSDVLTVGLRASVAVDGIDAEQVRRRPGTLKSLWAGRPVDPPDDVEAHLVRTDDLTSRADDLFLVVLGGNFGIGKDFYGMVGGSDESFARWGMEEVELGYRAYTCGGLLAPVREAFAWHQGRRDEGRDARERSLRLQYAKAAHRIAHRGLRGNRPGRIFSVPQHVVSVAADRVPADLVIETVLDVLADREHDLVVRVETLADRGDESFARWGMEEVELGYRAYTCGGLLAPVREAFAWHQGRRDEGRDARERSLRLQYAKAAHRIAHRGLRGNRPGRIFSVPQHVVSVAADRVPADLVVETVLDVLADREHDLVVRVETLADRGDGSELLRETFGPDPRVLVGSRGSALDEFPEAPFHVELPAAATFPRDLVSRLRTGLSDAATAHAVLPDGARVSITRTWALHRARRWSARPSDFGEERALSAAALGLGCRSASRGRAVEPAGHPTRWERLRDRARQVCSPKDAWAFSKWLWFRSVRRVAGLRR